MDTLPLFDYSPQIEHVSPDCSCLGKFCTMCRKVLCCKAFHYSHATSSKCTAYCKPCTRKYNQLQGRKKLYGLWPGQLQEMQNRANGKCELCGREETRIDKKTGLVAGLSVDHDHNSGVVRGLLCNCCNQLLGYVHDDIELLKEIALKAEIYLSKFREE